jgi:hypothetical protein
MFYNFIPKPDILNTLKLGKLLRSFKDFFVREENKLIVMISYYSPMMNCSKFLVNLGRFEGWAVKNLKSNDND